MSIANGILTTPNHGKDYDNIISSLLKDADQCQTLFEVRGLIQLIQTAVSVIRLQSPPVIPIALPLSVKSQILRNWKDK